MAQGGTFSQAPQSTSQPAQPAVQPPAAPAGGFGFGPNQFGPQVAQQTVQGGQPNAPLLSGGSYGFGPQQFGPQQQNPFGMTNNTFAAQQTPFSAPAQQPNLSTAIGQLKGGNQFDAQNTMRQIVGLPPLQAPAYNPNPGLSDAIGLLKSGNQAGAQDMMRQIVGLGQPAAAPPPPPQTYMNVAPPAAAPAPAAPASNMYAAPRRSLFGRR